MSKNKHTPGPWRLHTGTWSVIGCDDEEIVEAAMGDNLAQARANARLIAAAPEMLEALKRIRDEGNIETDQDLRGHVIYLRSLARAAIAKAEGGA